MTTQLETQQLLSTRLNRLILTQPCCPCASCWDAFLLPTSCGSSRTELFSLERRVIMTMWKFYKWTVYFWKTHSLNVCFISDYQVRRLIGDFGVPISMFLMIVLDYNIADTYTQVSSCDLDHISFLWTVLTIFLMFDQNLRGTAVHLNDWVV